MDFGPQARADLRRAFGEHRAVVLVGPRRRGVTFWAQAALSSDFDEFTTIDLRERSTAALIAKGLAEAMEYRSVEENGGTTFALSQLLSAFAERREGQALLFSNCYCADGDALKALLSAVADPPPGGQIRAPVIIEGAIDFDALCATWFPGGLPKHPVVLYAQAPSPWQRIVETEQVVTKRRPALSPCLIPFLCDMVDADLALLGDVLEALPGATPRVGQVAIERALQRAMLGSASTEIRRSLPADGTDADVVLRKLVAGHAVLSESPELLETCAIKTLYLAGLAAFDRDLGAYRVPGPLVARIIGESRHWPFASERAFVLSRAAYLLSITGGIELDVRALVRDHGLDAVAAIKVQAPTALVLRALRSAIAAAQLGEVEKKVVFAVLNDAAHSQQTLTEAAGARAKKALTDQEVLEWTNLSELVAVAQASRIVPDSLRSTADAFVARRNDIAHMRPFSVEEMEAITQHASGLIAGLRRP